MSFSTKPLGILKNAKVSPVGTCWHTKTPFCSDQGQAGFNVYILEAGCLVSFLPSCVMSLFFHACCFQEENLNSNPAAPDLDMDLDFGPSTIRKPTRPHTATATQLTQAGSTFPGFLATPAPFSSMSSTLGGASLAVPPVAGGPASSAIPDALLTPTQLCLRLLQVRYH